MITLHVFQDSKVSNQQDLALSYDDFHKLDNEAQNYHWAIASQLQDEYQGVLADTYNFLVDYVGCNTRVNLGVLGANTPPFVKGYLFDLVVGFQYLCPTMEVHITVYDSVMVNRAGHYIAEGLLKPDQVVVVRPDGSVNHYDEAGYLIDWPLGLFLADTWLLDEEREIPF